MTDQNHMSETELIPQIQEVKRKRGRPRKHPEGFTRNTGNPPGRPPSRPPGRPKGTGTYPRLSAAERDWFPDLTPQQMDDFEKADPMTLRRMLEKRLEDAAKIRGMIPKQIARKRKPLRAHKKIANLEPVVMTIRVDRVTAQVLKIHALQRMVPRITLLRDIILCWMNACSDFDLDIFATVMPKGVRAKKALEVYPGYLASLGFAGGYDVEPLPLPERPRTRPHDIPPPPAASTPMPTRTLPMPEPLSEPVIQEAGDDVVGDVVSTGAPSEQPTPPTPTLDPVTGFEIPEGGLKPKYAGLGFDTPPLTPGLGNGAQTLEYGTVYSPEDQAPPPKRQDPIV
jgi:hypothetical protein